VSLNEPHRVVRGFQVIIRAGLKSFNGALVINTHRADEQDWSRIKIRTGVLRTKSLSSKARRMRSSEN
jgi:hypothetical protein